jgi:hypothetical protein
LSGDAASQTSSSHHPYFQLDAPSQRALVAKAATLKPGDSYQTVVNLLGLPKSDQRLMRKESNRIIGRSLKYYAVIWESGLVNELHDEYVDVLLDETDHLKSVTVRVALNQ